MRIVISGDDMAKLAEGAPQASAEAVAMLRKYLDLALRGKITRLGIISEVDGERWQTEFSSSENRLLDAAMLLELGMRRMGFVAERE